MLCGGNTMAVLTELFAPADEFQVGDEHKPGDERFFNIASPELVWAHLIRPDSSVVSVGTRKEGHIDQVLFEAPFKKIEGEDIVSFVDRGRHTWGDIMSIASRLNDDIDKDENKKQRIVLD